MIDILQIEEGLWVLEEDGQNVLLKDCVKFAVSKAERKQLFLVLVMAAQRLRKGVSLDPLIDRGLLKKLSRQEKALSEEVWEARNPGGGGRIVFIVNDPESIIVSAVHKSRGSLAQAVNRGVNRWQTYLKEKGK